MKSLTTTIKKEIKAYVGYGFGQNRGLSFDAYIESGKLVRVELRRLITERDGETNITLTTDALELLRLIAPAMQDLLAEVEKELERGER